MTFTVSVRNRESYLESIDVLSPTYLSAIRTTLSRFDKYCKSKYKESEEEILSQLMKQNQDERIVNACDVLQLFISNLSKSISPQTIPSYLSHVLGYFNYRGVKLTSLDKKSIRLPKIIREEKYPLSKDDIKSILDNCSYKRKTLYLVLASSGMRIGETVQLRKKDFDTTGKRIVINIPAKFTKGKKSRRTLVSLEAKPYLMKRLNAIEEDDLVFGTGSTSAVTESKLLNYATKKAFPKIERYDSGTRKITLHSFRAFFITQAVRTVGESFAHTLAGQEGYLKVYKRYDDEAMLEDYLKLEPSLFIIHDYGLSEQSKDEEIDLLKSDMKDMKILVSGLVEEIKRKKSS